MTTFYAPPSSIQGSRVRFPEDEARHVTRVLRKQPGDEIIVVDGAGGWYRVRLDQAGKRRATGTILETRRDVGEPGYRLTIGLGLLKSRNRFETFLEKAVELGVRHIVPLRTVRTEKERLREARARNILIAAMKQCGRARLPVLAAPQSLTDEVAATERQTFICHEQADAGAGFMEALAGGVPDDLCILVGPEGGFTDAEVAEARAAGARAVSLGPRRLRAETAALTAAAAVMLAAGG